MSIDRTLLKPIIIVLLAAPLLFAAHWVREHAAAITGPLAVAANGQAVVVAAPGRLYYLSNTGALQHTDETTLDPAARDAGLAVMGDTFFVSPGSEGILQRCEQYRCSPFSSDPYTPTGAVQMAVSDHIIWISESNADRLHRFRSNGIRIDMPLSMLARPGSILQQGDQLFVSNAGTREILQYTIQKRGLEYPTTFAGYTGHNKDTVINEPTRLLFHNNHFLAIFSNTERTRGLLASIDSHGVVKELSIPGLINPVSIATLGGDALVLDEDRMQLFKINRKNEAAVFGDAEFNAKLTEQQALRDWLRLLWPLLTALAVLMLAGGSWLLHILFLRQPDAALTVKPGSGGIAWLPTEADLAPARAKRKMLVATPIALAPMILAIPLDYTLVGLVWAALVLAAAAAGPILAGIKIRPAHDLRIGLRNQELIVTDAERGLREFKLPKVMWNEKRLQPQADTTISLTRDGQALFHVPTLDAVLFPRLSPDNRLED